MSSSRPSLCELHSHCNELRRQEKFSDINVKVENRIFPCHRIILASAVEYFRTTVMFTGNTSEMELKGIEADDFELLLTHIYGGSVNLEGRNVYRLLRICHHVKLDTLSNSCEEYIIKNKEKIPLDILVDIFALASKWGNTFLVKELVGRLVQNFSTVSKEEKMFRISRKDLVEIYSCLDSKVNRVVMLDFLVEWAVENSADVDELSCYLLKSLKIPSDLQEWFIKSLKEKTVYRRKTSNAEDAIDSEEEISHRTSTTQQSRNQSPTIVLYCCDSADDNQGKELLFISQYEFNPKCNIIRARKEILKTEKAAYMKDMKFFKSVLINGVQLFFVFEECGIFTTRYDIHPLLHRASTKKIVNRKVEPHASHIHSPLTDKLASFKNTKISSSSNVCAIGSNVYFYNDNDFLMFNGELDRWTRLDDERPVRTIDANLISYQNSLYLLGGDSEYDKTLHNCKRIFALENGKGYQRYDPREGRWYKLPSMTNYRSRLSSCVHKDILYVTGGRNLSYHEGSMECYDFKACKWRTLRTRMPEQKMNHTVLGYNDRLYFFGGDDDFTWYSYNVKEEVGLWSDVFSVPQKRGSVLISRILDAEVKI